MKAHGSLSALLLTLAFSALGAPSGTAVGTSETADDLTVYYYDRLPFFGDIDGKPAGRLVDIARLMLDTAAIRYRLVNVPVVRAFEILKKPGNACIIGALKTPEREAVYAYSDAIYRDQPFRIIVNRAKRAVLPERPTIRQVLESGLRLGLSEGYVYGTWLDSRLADYPPPSVYRINVGSNAERMHQMLVGDRFDYMFSVAEEAQEIVSRTAENREHLTTVEIADAPPGNRRYLLCSKDIDDALMRRIDAAIAKVKASSGQPHVSEMP